MWYSKVMVIIMLIKKNRNLVLVVLIVVMMMLGVKLLVFSFMCFSFGVFGCIGYRLRYI